MAIPVDGLKSQAKTASSSKPKPTPRNRKQSPTSSKPISGKGTVIDLTGSDDSDALSPPSKKRKKAPEKSIPEEKRLRRFRVKAPTSYLDRLQRARTQRMFVIDRSVGGTDEVPEMSIEMAGTTGNVYSVKIAQMPSCTCPDSKKGNQCKHIVYVLVNVLKAPPDLQYQLAFLSSELQTIFASAPLPPNSRKTPSSSSSHSNRKEISGDCPICFTEFDTVTDEIIYCKAACGNNVHATCFEQWAKSQSGKEVRCVYCRTPWQGDKESIKRIIGGGVVNGEGYVNVAGKLGLSGVRDYSTYHPFWVQQQGLQMYDEF